jgi:transposase-like protein
MRRDYQVLEKKGRGKLSGKARKRLASFLAENGHLFLPMVDLVEESKIAVDELIEVTGRAVIETVLLMSAGGLAGPKHPGKAAGEIRWHGSQEGLVMLSNRKLRVTRPRLRKKGVGSGGEVSIPAYDAMQDDERMGARMLDVLMRGVSTRNYKGVIDKTADTVGVSRSSVSRNFIEAGERELKRLLERRFDDVDIIIIYIDGQHFGGHHVIGAVGVDVDGKKYTLGIYPGATENATVVKGLLEGLVERGIEPGRRRLFVIDGSKALRKAIDAVYGADNPVQRCRNHKVKNVMDHLPEELKDQVKSVMKAAYRLDYKDGMAKLEKQAGWLEHQYESAAASLREGLAETFTVNRLGLPPSLRRCLCTTNIIESPHSGVKMRTRRVSRWRDQRMVMYWVASAFLATEKNFRRIQGYRDLWVLKSVLDEDQVVERREVG